MMDIVFRLKPQKTENVHFNQNTATHRASDSKATRHAKVSLSVQTRVAEKKRTVPDYFHMTGDFNQANSKLALI